jgi:hypothetical protein
MKICLTILVAAVIGLASCTPGKERIAYIAKIDSLSAVLAKDNKAFQSIDTALIFSKIKKIDKQLAVFDSIDSVSLISEKGNYSELRNSFNLFLEENPQIIEEAQTCKNQLDNLKFDAENNLVNVEKLKQYYNQESNALTLLQDKMGLFQKKINLQLNNYELLNPKIEYLLDSLTKN